jgi:hypothetical protein
MIDGVSIQYSETDKAAFRRMAKLFPKEVARAHRQVASTIVRKIRAAVRNAGNQDTGPLTKLHELRLALQPGRPYGGILATQGKSLCRVQKRDNALYSGYVSNVEGIFSRWQMGGRKALGKHERQQLHRMLTYGGHRDMEVPKYSVQPKRDVIEPIAKASGPEVPRWIMSAMTKLINKTLSRKGL